MLRDGDSGQCFVKVLRLEKGQPGPRPRLVGDGHLCRGGAGDYLPTKVTAYHRADQGRPGQNRADQGRPGQSRAEKPQRIWPGRPVSGRKSPAHYTTLPRHIALVSLLTAYQVR